MAMAGTLCLFVSCHHSIRVYDGNNLLTTIEVVKEVDTTIVIKDYYITYRKSGLSVIGKVENSFSERKGEFKSMKSVEINISDKNFGIISP